MTWKGKEGGKLGEGGQEVGGNMGDWRENQIGEGVGWKGGGCIKTVV